MRFIFLSFILTQDHLFVCLFISSLYWVHIQRKLLSIPLFFHMVQSKRWWNLVMILAHHNIEHMLCVYLKMILIYLRVKLWVVNAIPEGLMYCMRTNPLNKPRTVPTRPRIRIFVFWGALKPLGKVTKGHQGQLVVKNALKVDNGLRASRPNPKKGRLWPWCNSSTGSYYLIGRFMQPSKASWTYLPQV